MSASVKPAMSIHIRRSTEAKRASGRISDTHSGCISGAVSEVMQFDIEQYICNFGKAMNRLWISCLSNLPETKKAHIGRLSVRYGPFIVKKSFEASLKVKNVLIYPIDKNYLPCYSSFSKRWYTRVYHLGKEKVIG